MALLVGLLSITAGFVATTTAVAVIVDNSTPQTTETGQLTSVDSDPPVDQCAAESPEDFADPPGGTAGTLGWVEGVWYDEPIDVSLDDGLSEAELQLLAARTAARIEAMRCLPAVDGVPPVTIITREDLEDARAGEPSDDEGDDDRNEENEAAGGEAAGGEAVDFDDVAFETMLMIDSETDAGDVQQEQQTAIVGGWYDFINEEITIVTDDPEAIEFDEGLLAHELGHAIQDQHFDLQDYLGATTDEHNGLLGLIEGDVHLLEQRYIEACIEDRWEQDCHLESTEGEYQDDDDVDPEVEGPAIQEWGLYLMTIQPYSDGPSFIEYHYQVAGGWAGVDDLYEEPPRSALEVADPERDLASNEFEITLRDRSDGGWERVNRTAPGLRGEEIGYDTIGISGLAAMLAQPTAETGGVGGIVAPTEFQNIDPDGTLNQSNPFNYRFAATTGWVDDRLAVYRSDTGETASVWKLAWEDDEDAETFAGAYEELIHFRGGESDDSGAGTYTFDNASGYDRAFDVTVTETTVTIVTAPDVDSLNSVYNDSLVDTREHDNEDTGEGGELAPDSGPGVGADTDRGIVLLGAIVGAVLGGLILTMGIRSRRNRSR